ncbi:hypothetical protein C2G38_2232869 [Gigaspora rosea]|uniref:Uncharacterized protein n=1 Tax=Gigaspora rosea TaxID=44941 RepID=A0A397TRM0_9GLOM|nr:hypothetical protein C2G38_2232869 [Gigaspora rosea]
MAYRYQISQSIDISDNEWDSLFDTSQNVNNSDSKQDFDNDKGPNNRQNSDDKQGSGNKQNSENEWDSDSVNEDIQNPENPSTLNFNEQAILNEEITDDPQLIKLGKANVEIVTKVKYLFEFEEYPETSEGVVACIYNVTGMDPNKALEIFDLKNIQYFYKE